MKEDTKLFCMMSRGYTLSVEYLGYDAGFHYTLIHDGVKVDTFTSMDGQDIDGVEKAYLRHYRDRQLKSILDDVKINYFNGFATLEG